MTTGPSGFSENVSRRTRACFRGWLGRGMPMMSASRDGLLLLEVVFAVGLLLVAATALLSLSVGSGRTAEAASQRMMMELRARRLLAAVAASPFQELATAGAGMLSLAPLPEPADARGYLERVDSVKEEAHVSELERGLLEVIVRVGWTDRASGMAHAVVVRSLIGDPAWSLTTHEQPSVP